MLSRARQCGMDPANMALPDVIVVATMDRHDGYSHIDLSKSMFYFASVLNLAPWSTSRFCIPPIGRSSFLLRNFPTCKSMLVDPLQSLHNRLFIWQSHFGRCLQAHEVLKLLLKRLTFYNSDPGEIAIPSNQLLIPGT